MDKVSLVASKIKELVLPEFDIDSVQTFDTRNVIGDYMANVYNANGIIIDVCYGYNYIEVFGLSDKEYEELLKLDICH